MVKIEDMCCCCDLPCINCGRRHVPVAVCDWCEAEEEKFFERDDDTLCEDCFIEAELKDAEKVSAGDAIEEDGDPVTCCAWCEAEEAEFYLFNGEAVCEECYKEAVVEVAETISDDDIISNYRD